jgi:hypothetical protein
MGETDGFRARGCVGFSENILQMKLNSLTANIQR